jgi:hypothetical protein
MVLMVLFAMMTAFVKLWARLAGYFPINDWFGMSLGFNYNWLGSGGGIPKNDRQLSMKITVWLADCYWTNSWGKCLGWSSYGHRRHEADN